MRALLFSLIFALFAAPAAHAQTGDPNEDLRRYVNGVWQLTFREEVKGGTGDIKSVSTVITITLRYDGTRTITQDETVNDRPPIRTAETHDYYRVDEIDGTNFTLTAWSDTDAPKATRRMRAGADQMKVEGSDAIYQRVAGTQEAAPTPLPPQRDPPGAGSPPAAAASPDAQQSLDARLRDFLIGRWTASATQNGTTVESMLDYRTSGEVVGYQNVTTNGSTRRYDVKGAYTVVASGDKAFTLTFYLPGLQPVSTVLEIVDADTMLSRAENYQTKRVR